MRITVRVYKSTSNFSETLRFISFAGSTSLTTIVSAMAPSIFDILLRKMREQNHGQYQFFIGDDLNFFYREGGAKPSHEKFHKNQMEFMFTKRKLFTELFEVWGKKFSLHGYKILEAHGDFYNGEWVIGENHKSLGTVRDWVNKYDGTVTALMVTSCNPCGSELFSEHSLVLHTSRLVPALPCMINTQGLIRVFVPGNGYMENDYKGLRRLINRLR
jgi:hypothetical protein